MYDAVMPLMKSDTGTQVPSSKDDMVALAVAQGWVKTVVQRNEEATLLV
jgi:hypothetical protein